jgi:amidase
MKVVLDAQPWLLEPILVELPWKESIELPKSMKIAVMWHDGVVQPHPPITKCLQETAKALAASGHTLIKWDLALHRDLINCVNVAYFLDGGAEYKEVLATGNEPATPLLDWLLKKGNPREYTVSETWKVRRSWST